MNWFQRLLRRPAVDAGMDEEMAFHHEARIADLIARGHTEQEAAAARLFGYRPWDELRRTSASPPAACGKAPASPLRPSRSCPSP